MLGPETGVKTQIWVTAPELWVSERRAKTQYEKKKKGESSVSTDKIERRQRPHNINMETKMFFLCKSTHLSTNLKPRTPEQMLSICRKKKNDWKEIYQNGNSDFV